MVLCLCSAEEVSARARTCIGDNLSISDLDKTAEHPVKGERHF